MNNILGVTDRGDACGISPNMANRHGLIAGATGTGKTVTLRKMAEGFSDMGTPVFLVDMKGDLSGMCVMGDNEKFKERAEDLGVDFEFDKYPCCYWDVYKENGFPVRVTIKEAGSFLLSRVLGLTRVQCGVLDLIFRISEDKNYRLNTVDDLKKVIHYISNNTEEFFSEYGTIYPSSIGAILRAVIGLEQQGGNDFFGSPELKLDSLIQTRYGKGVVNIMDCTKLVRRPIMYATFIIWLLDKLYNELPEVGDCDKPKFVLFFDEAHLLFEDSSKIIANKIAQIVRLIRSKGVGIYFVSQSPSDLPDRVLSQLSNRVQHSLRAFTPLEQKAVKVAAQTFRPNPRFDTTEKILNLGVGEALVSFLDETGVPQMVDVYNIVPPKSNLVVLNSEERELYNDMRCRQQKKECNTDTDTRVYTEVPTHRASVNTSSFTSNLGHDIIDMFFGQCKKRYHR